MVEEKNLFLYEILNEFQTLGEELLFSELLIKNERDITNVYLLRDASYEYALQLEFDWRECDIFMYIVYLKNGNIPSSNDIYVYTDGTWCRKYIEEIYSIKNPIYNEKQSLRYTKDFIKYKFNFYYNLIKTHPDTIRRRFCD